MITDNSAPRAMYALGPTIMTTTLSLTAYLHATVEELAEVGDDFILSAKAASAAAAPRTNAPATGAGTASCWPPASSWPGTGSCAATTRSSAATMNFP
jgi:hypothetical protein